MQEEETQKTRIFSKNLTKLKLQLFIYNQIEGLTKSIFD